MSEKKAGKRNNAARTAARLSVIVASAWLAAPRAVSAATFTWIGSSGSWGDSAQWTGSTSAVPPNSNTAESFLGNNGTVSLSGGTFIAAALHVGYVGGANAGTGKLVVDSGTLTLAQNITVGEGNAGTIIINGGQLATSTSKNFWLGGGTLGTSTAYLEVDSGTLQLNNKAGILPWTTSPGVSTINMSGGIIDFVVNDNADTILASDFNFSGGAITNISAATINELSGNGSITLRNNNANAGVTVNQAIDTSFDGLIITAGTGSLSGAGKFTKSGAGSLTLGADTLISAKTQMLFSGGTVRLGRSETFSTGTMAFTGGTLDLNGFTQTVSVLQGNGTINLGSGGQLNVTPGTGLTTVYDGLITGSGTFSKSSGGVLALTGNQTFTGATNITNGTLSLSNSGTNSLSGSSTITINTSGNLNVTGIAGGFTLSPGQTLSLNGHVFGNTSVPSGTTLKSSGTSATFSGSLTVGGTIAANGSVGTLTAGSLSLSNASVNVELDATGADKIVVSTPDGLSLSGTSTIALTNLGGLNAGTYTIIDYSGTPLADLGHLSLASSTLGNFNVALHYNSLDPTSIDLSVISNITNATWNFNGDGTISDATKWDGGVPNGIDNIANFGTHGGSITASPVTVTLDQNTTLGVINFDHPSSSYTLAASGTNSLMMDVSSGQAAINVISGNHTISAPVTLNDDTTITVTPATSTLSVTGNLTATGKTITKAGLGAVQFQNVQATGLNVTAGTVSISQKIGTPNSMSGTSIVSNLSIAANSAVDLTNNAMIIPYTTLGTLLGDTRQALSDHRLTTSLAAGGHALGYADNALLGRTTFGGQSVNGSNVLIAYTFAGDANLDGTVNLLDLNALATNFGNAGSGMWMQGDFTYDGAVNIADFNALAGNFGQSLGAIPASPLGALVPEPLVAFPVIWGMIWLGSGRGAITKRRTKSRVAESGEFVGKRDFGANFGRRDFKTS